MMLMVWLLIGAVMGLRFRVLILVPAMGLALPVTVVSGIIQGASLGHVFLAATLAIVGLQVGYLAGIGVRHLLVLARVGRIRTSSAVGPAREVTQ